MLGGYPQEIKDQERKEKLAAAAKAAMDAIKNSVKKEDLQ